MGGDQQQVLNKIEIQSMALCLNPTFNEAVPFQMPFHRKQNIVLTRLLNRPHFQQTIRKTITVVYSDRPIFQHIWSQLQAFMMGQEGVGNILWVRGVQMARQERQEGLYYDITRAFFNCNTLKQCLLDERPELAPTPALITTLLSAYARTIHLNHILCTSTNIYFSSQQAWSKRPFFEFNFTSVGFIFDCYRSRPLCRGDLVECANYLPRSFYRQEMGKRFGFQLKVRSLAVNLLEVVVQRDVDFTRSFPNKDFYDQAKISAVLDKVHSCFQEFLSNSKIKQQVKKVSMAIGADLMVFFRSVLLQDKNAPFQQFDSWVKIIRYFNLPVITPYKTYFQLESAPSSTSSAPSRTCLQSWLLKKRDEQDEYIKRKLRALGLMSGESVQDIILYVLYLSNLISEPNFSEANEPYHPKFIKKLISFYAEIIGSDFLLEPSPQKDLSKAKSGRNESLFKAVRALMERLNQLSTKTPSKETLLYVSKEGIDLKTVYQKCWHFRQD